MNIAAIVVTYKDASRELENLKKSLLQNGLKEEDIYFSDNTKKNLGYGGGINRILKNILKKYDAFFILNPDIILGRNCLNSLIEILKGDARIGIVGPKILDGSGKLWSLGGELDKTRYSGGLIGYGKKNGSTLLTNKINHVDFISGTAMLIRKEVFEKIGLFAEDYFLYYEDVDFCFRARQAGFDLAINTNAVITHFASRTVGKDSPQMLYYLARNHMLFVERFASLQVKLHELFRLPKTVYQERKYGRLGIRDYFLRRFGKHDYWS